MIKISIVTISFNQRKYLKNTIESILNQNYPLLEYIIVDAGSTDGSRELVMEYKSELFKTLFEEDSGQANGLNKGFKYASGEIYGFVNSDDILLPGALHAIEKYFQLYSNAAIIYGDGIKIDQSGNILKNIISDPFEINRFAHGAVTFTQPSVFIKASSFNQVNGFNEFNSTCWDSELIVDIAISGGKIIKINKKLSGFRIHKESITGSSRLLEEYKEDRIRIFEKIMKRKPNLLDGLLVYIFQIEKLVRNPRKLFHSI